MCSQDSGIARVVSATLYVYRKDENREKMFLAQYEITAKAGTFSFEYVQDLQQPMAADEEQVDATSFVETNNMNNVAGNIEGQNMCEDVKKMLLQLPDATEEQVHKYLQKEYSMTDDEIEGLKKICKLGADNSKGQDVCEDVKKMLLQLPDATEEQVHKYLQTEYSMTDDEIEGLNKMCKFKEELGKKHTAKRKSESTKEDNFNGQNMCEDVKKMLLQLPDATEEQVHKYLQKEYSMTDDEIKGLNKMCKFKEELGKKDSAKRKSESTKEDNFDGREGQENAFTTPRCYRGASAQIFTKGIFYDG